MLLLPPDRYPAVLERIREVPFNTYFAEAILRRHVHGRVWTDSARRPRVFLVAHPCGLSLLFGRTDQAQVDGWLSDYLLNTDRARRTPEFLQVHPDGWTERIASLLGTELAVAAVMLGTAIEPAAQAVGRSRVIQWSRLNFRFNRDAFQRVHRAALPPDCRIESVGAACLEWSEGHVLPRMFWDNAADFAARGVAYAVFHGDEPVSGAFSAFAIDRVLEIGIETRAADRGRGMATHAGAAFIEHCVARDLEPVWACRKGNLGSERTALGLGFEPTAELPYYALRVD